MVIVIGVSLIGISSVGLIPVGPIREQDLTMGICICVPDFLIGRGDFFPTVYNLKE